MAISLSELDSRVMESLEAAQEWLDLSDVHSQVVQTLNARTMQSRSSDINVLLATTAEFTPDSVLYDITSLIGKAVPAFVEIKGYVGQDIERWQMVRVVNLNQLDDYRNIGAFACAFYGEEPATDEDAQPTQYLNFTYLPARPCRIRFDRDGQRTALEADQLLPDNLSHLIVLEAQNSLIDRIIFKIGMDMRRDTALREIAPTIIAGLQGIKMQNLTLDIPPLHKQWMVWAYRDRAAQSSFNNPTPSGANLYAAGRNKIGGYGGYGGGGT